MQDKKAIDLNAGAGIAVREYQTDIGPADYVLFVDKTALGVIEAKKEEVGQNITTVEDQTSGYAGAKLKWINNNQPVPFLYESTGTITRFTDARDPKPRSREVFSFHRPETMRAWVEAGTSLRARLAAMPLLNPQKRPAAELGLRDCQEAAVTKLEISFKDNRPRALITIVSPLVELLDSIRREKEQTLNHEHFDTLRRAEWDKDARQNAEALARDFSAWLLANREQLTALTIFYAQPARRREVTFAMLEAVMTKLRADAPRTAPLRVWQAYRQLENYQGRQPLNELTALVALIRRACGIDAKLAAFDDTVRRNFQDWIMRKHAGTPDKFTGAQTAWLQMIRDHISTSFHLERDDLDMAPFDSEGGLGKMFQLFGERTDPLIAELNEALVA